MDDLPAGVANITTSRVKWDRAYQKKIGLRTGPRRAQQTTVARIQRTARRIHRALGLSGAAASTCGWTRTARSGSSGRIPIPTCASARTSPRASRRAATPTPSSDEDRAPGRSTRPPGWADAGSASANAPGTSPSHRVRNGSDEERQAPRAGGPPLLESRGSSDQALGSRELEGLGVRSPRIMSRKVSGTTTCSRVPRRRTATVPSSASRSRRSACRASPAEPP